MLKRVMPFAACVICIFALMGAPRTAHAQSQENGAVVITVTDAASHKPIDSAQVFLLGGDTPQSSLTNAKGLLVFEDLQPGSYRIEVMADGYDRTDFTNVELGEGQRVDVAVKLVSKFRTIASVVARSSVDIRTEGIDENSAQRKVSPSLSDALNKLAGVNVDDQLYGSDSAFNVSLRNADAGQTAFLIDGVHVAGAASRLTGAAQDLFSGASVNFAPSAFGSAGSVNFMTLQPTKIWSYGFTGQVGNYGATSGTWSLTGGSGKVTLALEHAAAGADLPLSGMFYADQTGKAYEHLGGWARNTDLFKANLALSPASNLKLSTMNGRGRFAGICSDFTTLSPCSEGPDNATNNRWNYETAMFESLAGHVQYDVFANLGDWNSATAMPNRAVNGVAIPYFDSSESPWFSYGAYTRVTKRRHTLSSGFYSSVQNSGVTSTYNGVARPRHVQWERNGGFWIENRIKSNDKLATTYNVSQSAATGAGTSAELGVSLTWQPAKRDTFSFSLGAGSANPVPADPSPIGDALSAQYDCYNQSVYVDGPSEPAVRQASQSYDAGWRRTFRGGFFNVDFYRRNLFGQTFRAGVPLSSEPPSLFPGGSLAAYLAQIENMWSQSTVCGAMPFNAERVYVSQMLSGLSQVDQGVTMSGQFRLGKNVMLFPTYATASAYLSSLDPRLIASGSYYAPGVQLPHRPLRTAGLTVDGALPKWHAEWLANAQFTSANNSNNLPAYTIYGAGFVVHGTYGSITVVESNIFGTHTGLFTTYQDVGPMPLQGGGTFAFSTTPLPPRSLTVQYQVRWHQHESKPAPRGSKRV